MSIARLLLALSFAMLVSGVAVGHQPFRITDDGPLPSAPDEPALEATAVFDDPDCSIYREAGGTRFYAIPTGFYREPGLTNALFGVSLESEAQDHIVVILVHGIDQARLDACIGRYSAGTGGTNQVALYPARVTDVELISDPHDHLVGKFHFLTSTQAYFNNQLQIMTILQSSSRANVRVLKKALALRFDAVATVQIKVMTSGGAMYESLTVPMALGEIQLSSQGL